MMRKMMKTKMRKMRGKMMDEKEESRGKTKETKPLTWEEIFKDTYSRFDEIVQTLDARKPPHIQRNQGILLF